MNKTYLTLFVMQLIQQKILFNAEIPKLFAGMIRYELIEILT